MQGKRILFLSEEFGKGHQRVAQAMAKAITIIEPQSQCSVINVCSEYMPRLFKFFNQAYLRSIKYSPSLYRKMYEKPNNSSMWSVVNSSLGGIYRSTLIKIIRELKPDMVVCTHPFPAIVLGKLKASGLEIPMAITVTDYGFNQSWFVKEADLIMVATEEQKNLAFFLGIPQKKVWRLGIPIDPNFKILANQTSKYTLKQSLGLDPDLPLVLVMGGGLGLALSSKELKELLNNNRGRQLVIVTGSNKELKNKLEKKIPASDRVKVLGWIDNAHQFLLAADLLVSKPGGVTMAEALGVGLPTLLIDPLPGQEEENMDYILRNDAGVYYSKTKHIGLGNMIDKTFKEVELMKDVSENAREIGSLNAAIDGGKLIIELIEEKADQGGLCHGLSK